jgi:hypothetical protein
MSMSLKSYVPSHARQGPWSGLYDPSTYTWAVPPIILPKATTSNDSTAPRPSMTVPEANPIICQHPANPMATSLSEMELDITSSEDPKPIAEEKQQSKRDLGGQLQTLWDLADIGGTADNRSSIREDLVGKFPGGWRIFLPADHMIVANPIKAECLLETTYVREYFFANLLWIMLQRILKCCDNLSDAWR